MNSNDLGDNEPIVRGSGRRETRASEGVGDRCLLAYLLFMSFFNTIILLCPCPFIQTTCTQDTFWSSSEKGGWEISPELQGQCDLLGLLRTSGILKLHAKKKKKTLLYSHLFKQQTLVESHPLPKAA